MRRSIIKGTEHYGGRMVEMGLDLGFGAPQVDYPLGYWPGVILFHSIYALFEAKRFDNFQKYGEVRCWPATPPWHSGD